MKKAGLCLLLATSLFVASGCGKNETETPTETALLTTTEATTQENTMQDSISDQVDSYVRNNEDSLSGDDTDLDDLQTSESGDTSEATEGSTESIADGSGDFEKRDDYVYATTNVTVRNLPSTSADAVMTLKQGESIHRIGYGEVWTEVEKNGIHFYIATKYLSEAQP